MRDTLKRQKVNTKEEFDERLKQVSTEFAEQVRRRGGGWRGCQESMDVGCYCNYLRCFEVCFLLLHVMSVVGSTVLYDKLF